MSRAAKATLLTSVLLTGLTIWGVRFMQEQERENMYKGVLRDDDRRREKMKQRQEELRESQRKRALYEQYQHVSKQDDGQNEH
ncbi:hypothetical protein OE88DRAFT_1664426, partial [Heliocybe sulcata]